MAMFGERSSESPRLPSPWQQALATPSPAISIISHNSTDFEIPSPTSRHGSRRRRSSGSSLALRTPSQLSLSTAEDEPEDSVEIDSSASLTSTSAFQRLRSSGISENLILHVAPEYAASSSTSTSASFGQSAGVSEHARHGVSGGLAGVGYEGIKLIAERDKVGHIEYKVCSSCKSLSFSRSDVQNKTIVATSPTGSRALRTAYHTIEMASARRWRTGCL